MLFGHIFERVAEFKETEKVLYLKFESKFFVDKREREVQKLLVNICKRYFECYPKLLIWDEELHNSFFEELMNIKLKLDDSK